MVPLGTVTRNGQKVPITGNALKTLPNLISAQMAKKEELYKDNMRMAMGWQDGKFAEAIKKVNIADAGSNKDDMRRAMAQIAAA